SEINSHWRRLPETVPDIARTAAPEISGTCSSGQHIRRNVVHFRTADKYDCFGRMVALESDCFVWSHDKSDTNDVIIRLIFQRLNVYPQNRLRSGLLRQYHPLSGLIAASRLQILEGCPTSHC